MNSRSYNYSVFWCQSAHNKHCTVNSQAIRETETTQLDYHQKQLKSRENHWISSQLESTEYLVTCSKSIEGCTGFLENQCGSMIDGNLLHESTKLKTKQETLLDLPDPTGYARFEQS